MRKVDYRIFLKIPHVTIFKTLSCLCENQQSLHCYVLTEKMVFKDELYRSEDCLYKKSKAAADRERIR